MLQSSARLASMPTTEASSSRDRLIGLARVAVAGLIWGSIPLFLRAADGAPTVKVFFRVLFAALVIGGFMAVTGRLKEVTTLSRAKLLQVVGQGLILTLNWILFFSALEFADVATAELLGYTGPVFVAALAPFVTGERFDRRIVAPLAFALAGIAVILVPHGIGVQSTRQLLGAAMAAGSAVTYATLLLRSKKILRGISSLSLMLVEYTVASIALTPFVIYAYSRGDVPTGVNQYAALATLGIVHSAISGLIFLGGLRRVRTDHAAVLTYVEPVSAVLFAALFLAEPLTIWTGIGGAMVIGGGIFVARLEAKAGVETVPMEAAGTEECGGAPECHDPADDIDPTRRA